MVSAVNERLERRQQESQSLVKELEAWMRAERAKLSRSSPVAEPIDYMLKRWDGFTTFLSDGRICLTNNAAERALRGFALGRKSWLFAGSDRGADQGCLHGDADHDRQAQRHRPSGLACRCPRPHRRYAGYKTRRAAAVAVETGNSDHRVGRVNRARNSSSERRKPSSLRTTDFDLFAGSAIRPF